MEETMSTDPKFESDEFDDFDDAGDFFVDGADDISEDIQTEPVGRPLAAWRRIEDRNNERALRSILCDFDDFDDYDEWDDCLAVH
jgi:hypothetical protein